MARNCSWHSKSKEKASSSALLARKSRILNEWTWNRLWKKLPCFWRLFFRIFSRTMELWRHRFFQNWHTPELIMCLLHSVCTPPLSLANFSSTIVLQSSWEDCIFPKGYENNTLCLIWKANRVHYGGFENSQWEGGGHPSHLFITTYLTKPRRRWQRERKKKNRFHEQNNNSARVSRFFVYFFVFTAQPRREITKF